MRQKFLWHTIITEPVKCIHKCGCKVYVESKTFHTKKDAVTWVKCFNIMQKIHNNNIRAGKPFED